MEEKFKKFIDYDWKNSAEWNEYYHNNCYIPPPVTGEAIVKARKKFYKLKIDPDFDVNYIPKHLPEHKHECSSKKKEERKSIVDQLTCAIEGFFWIAFFLNVLVPRYILDVCAFVCVFRFFRLNIFRMFHKSFWGKHLLKNGLIHLIVYSFVLRIDHINYLNLFPFTITAFYCVCEYFCNYLRLFQFTKKYFKKVVDAKERIFRYRGYSYVFFGIYLIFAIVIKWSNIYIGMVYPVFLIFMYYHNVYVKEAVLNMQKLPEKLKKNNVNI